MTNSFTPGPWECQGNEISARYLNSIGDVELVRCVRSGDDRYVAFACLDGMTDGPRTSSEERRANAKLIAAAPDMYEALQYALKELTACKDLGMSLNKSIELATAALAKVQS